MTFDDDNYVLDAEEPHLVGLTLDETREFESLDELIVSHRDLPMSSVSTDDDRSQNQRRWLVFYEKHEAATLDCVRGWKDTSFTEAISSNLLGSARTARRLKIRRS